MNTRTKVCSRITWAEEEKAPTTARLITMNIDICIHLRFCSDWREYATIDATGTCDCKLDLRVNEDGDVRHKSDAIPTHEEEALSNYNWRISFR